LGSLLIQYYINIEKSVEKVKKNSTILNESLVATLVHQNQGGEGRKNSVRERIKSCHKKYKKNNVQYV